MSNIELPPLTHEKEGPFRLYWQLNALRVVDRFKYASPDLPEDERRALARDVRAQARISFKDPLKYVAWVVLGPIFGFLWFVSLFLHIPLAISLVKAGTFNKDLFFATLCPLIFWPYTIYLLRINARIRKGLRGVAARFPGSVGVSRHLEFLDWLDNHWPAASPIDEIESILGLHYGGRWDLQSSYRDLPFMIRVCDKFVLPASAPRGRVSIYLSAPRGGVSKAPISDEVTESFRKLGFDAFRTPAGMYMCHHGLSLEALNPERIDRILDLAYRTIPERNGQ